MIELIKSVNDQLRKLAVRKNISWKDSESEQEFLKIINEELPKHQEWIKEGISMLENTKNDLDEALEGYTKSPLKRGEGVRYYDGRGNSWQLNYGYANATDEIHSGAYLKTTVGEGIVRIPLNGGK